MLDQPVKTRFAPSPTGALHLGNLRTALFSWLLARSSDGVFLLRIEDTDTGRSDEAHLAGLLEDLHWLGLAWDEGPEVDGRAGPYRQSQRGALYEVQLQQLLAQGDAYPCFCSESTLAAARAAARAAGRAPRYPGTCAGIPRAESQQRIAAGEFAALRFRIPSNRAIAFEDLVRGPQHFCSDDIGDFIIRRADGSPAFLLANAVDDALMGVSHVLRGEDHLSNTPRQQLILQALGLPVPAYGHLPLIVGPGGAPLSKREGSPAAAELRRRGYLPAAVLNLLVRLGHHYREQHLLELDEMAAGFSLEALGRSPAQFDPGQLDHWQQQALAEASAETLWAWFPPPVRARVPEDRRGEFLAAVRANLLYPEDGTAWADIVFGDGRPAEADAKDAIDRAGSSYFEQALAALDQAGDDYGAVIAALRARTGLKGRALFEPLRAALTGRLDGPELKRLVPLMGVERLRRRLQNCV